MSSLRAYTPRSSYAPEIRERRSDVEEFDQAITELAKVIATTAMESEAVELYSPCIGHLVKARRALREAFDK